MTKKCIGEFFMNFNPGIDALLHYDLTEVIEDMMDYVDLIDDNFQSKPFNFIMKYWQFQGVTLKEALFTDLMDWLCCLAMSDGFVAPQEVLFINRHLRQRLSVNDIIDLSRVRINEDYFNRLPLSFILLFEDDMIMNSLGVAEYNNVEKLYMLFMIIGVQFIYCDNDVDFNELAILRGYTEGLSRRIRNFDLKTEQLFALERLAEELGEEYSNKDPFSQEAFDDYYDKLSELEGLEEFEEEVSLNNSSSSVGVNPWNTPNTNVQTNPWQSGETKTNNPWQSDETKVNSPWDLEINPNEYYNFTGEFENHLDDFRDILTRENHLILENVHLTPNQYRSILNKIKSTSDSLLEKSINDNNIDFTSLTILEKVLLFTKSFVNVDYKAGGADLGNYAFNKINLDDRLDTANQITTLIHELSHHLLAEIFEQATMILFNTDKTDAIESFVGFSLMCSDPSILLNEYCAHTVQGRFTPHGYQNYGSFENILQRFDPQTDREIVSVCMMVGNTFCKDLLDIIEPFIDYNLREEIKQQFKKDIPFRPDYRGISLEIRDTLDVNQLLNFINSILLMGFNEALENPEMLLNFRKQFKLHNNKSRF